MECDLGHRAGAGNRQRRRQKFSRAWSEAGFTAVAGRAVEQGLGAENQLDLPR